MEKFICKQVNVNVIEILSNLFFFGGGGWEITDPWYFLVPMCRSAVKFGSTYITQKLYVVYVYCNTVVFLEKEVEKFICKQVNVNVIEILGNFFWGGRWGEITAF